MPITIKPMTEKQRLWYNEARLDERRRIDILIEKQKRDHPYPIDVFPEMSTDQINDCVIAIENHPLGIPFDRLSANISRKVWLGCCQEIQDQIKDGGH